MVSAHPSTLPATSSNPNWTDLEAGTHERTQSTPPEKRNAGSNNNNSSTSHNDDIDLSQYTRHGHVYFPNEWEKIEERKPVKWLPFITQLQFKRPGSDEV
jgi:hypothetical protein